MNKSTLEDYLPLLDVLIERKIPFVIGIGIKGKRMGRRTFLNKKVKRKPRCLLIRRGCKHNGTPRWRSIDVNTKITYFAVSLY